MKKLSASAGVISIADNKNKIALSTAWYKEKILSCMVGEQQAYVTGPVQPPTAGSVRACSNEASMGPDPDFTCVSVRTVEQRREQRVPDHDRFCFSSR